VGLHDEIAAVRAETVELDRHPERVAERFMARRRLISLLTRDHFDDTDEGKEYAVRLTAGMRKGEFGLTQLDALILYLSRSDEHADARSEREQKDRLRGRARSRGRMAKYRG
jgi:hypothetical protein